MTDRFILALAATGMAALSAGALWVSYWHAHSFVSAHGAHGASAYIVAFTVDGLILMSVTAIAMARRAGQDVPMVARLSLVVGLAGTGVANAWSGAGHGLVGIAVGLWVPLVLELGYQMLMWTLRTAAERDPGAVGQREWSAVPSVEARQGEHVQAPGHPSGAVLDVGEPGPELARAHHASVAPLDGTADDPAERVRAVLAELDASGHPRPGRGRLARLARVSERVARGALAAA